MKCSVYGIGFIRNGVKYDYPFKESVASLKGFCDDIYYLVGEGEDSTEKEMGEIKGIHLRHNKWDDSLRTGGLILSQQTNEAIDYAKKNITDSDKAWLFYLQSDEVIHEDDYHLIREDIQKAHDQGCDAIRFRYFHFWLRYDQIAIAKKWYPQEIRCIKSDSQCESWGDAQSFQNYTNVYESDATIYHYGHVREEDAYKNKKWDILDLYHGDDGNRKKHVLDKQERHQDWIPFLGSHPKVMWERMKSFNYDIKKRTEVEKAYLLTDRNLSEELLKKIDIKEYQVIKNKKGLELKKGEVLIDLRKKGVLDSFFSKSRVPDKMHSPFARQWPFETIAMLKMSEKGVAVR